jgi:hypothetical protein
MVFDRAVALLLHDLERKKLAQTNHPRETEKHAGSARVRVGWRSERRSSSGAGPRAAADKPLVGVFFRPAE